MGCAAEEGTPAEPVPEATRRPPVLTEVNLPFPVVLTPFRWDDEFRGLAAAVMEIGLSDLPGVIVDLPTDGPPPAFLGAHPTARRQVDARLVVRPQGKGESLELELELCIAGGGCESHRSTGPRDRPWEMFGALLEGAAGTLEIPVDDTGRARWRTSGRFAWTWPCRPRVSTTAIA
jgi:hypothetical protein